MKKEKGKKNKEMQPQLTREELLGFGSEIFSLNQAEYVSKKIIDQILFHVFETIRIHNVKQMNFDYSAFRSFINLQNIVNLGLIKPEKEIEVIEKHSFDFDVNPCKIDAWASGHAKIITSTQPKEQLIPPSKSEKNEQSSKARKKEKDKDKSETMLRGRKRDDKKLLVKEQPPKELPMDFITSIEEKKELVSFNYDEMKLKGYRAYFQEKQIEMQKRKQLEKEQAERAKEEEKKLKQIKDLMNTGKLVSWDANGAFLPLKLMKENDLKYLPQPRQKIIDSKNIYDQDGIFDLDEQGNPKKKKQQEIIKEPPPTVQKTENYYQPNPLVSHDLPQGVTLEFYGNKKSGGKYEVGNERLTMEQYQHLLEQIKPYSRAQIEERLDESYDEEEKEKDNEEKVDENGEQISKEKNIDKRPVKKTKTMNAKSKKLYYLFRDEIIKAEEEKERKKKNQDNIIKQKKKKEEKKEKVLKDKIQLRDFNFKEIKNTQDKSIYKEIKEKEKIEEGYSDFFVEQKQVVRLPSEKRTKDEQSIRIREKRFAQMEPAITYNENLPNTIKKTLTKIKEESEEIEKNKKLLLPPIKSRPKSNYIFNKNNNKKIANKKNKKE